MVGWEERHLDFTFPYWGSVAILELKVGIREGNSVYSFMGGKVVEGSLGNLVLGAYLVGVDIKVNPYKVIKEDTRVGLDFYREVDLGSWGVYWDHRRGFSLDTLYYVKKF